MEFNLNCEQYVRLSALPKMLDQAETRVHFRSIFVERHNNHLYLIATNVKTAAIEYLGPNDGPDEETAIAIDEMLIEACRKEIEFNSKLSIIANSMLAFTSAKTTFGYLHPNNLHVNLPEQHNFYGWRDWLPPEIPTTPHGAMMWNADLIATLGNSAPSGIIRFPTCIDSRRPVVVRDVETDNWLGLFMPSPGDRTIEPASIPEWINL